MKKISRRHFIKTGAAVAATSSWLMNLPAMAHAATGDEYKALVCVFLAGGNDHNNTVIPYDNDNYNTYKDIRPEVAVSQSSILPLFHEGQLPFNLKLGLNENMAGMQSLFNAGKMAIQLNVGPLFEPVTKEDYETAKHKLPPKLFSHNDQQSIWQASQAEGADRGWGGSSGDTQIGQNTNSIFSCISIAGNNVFLAGDNVNQLSITDSGMGKIYGSNPQDWKWGGNEVSVAASQLIVQNREHPIEAAYTAVNRRAIEAQKKLSAALASVGLENANIFDEAMLKNYKLTKQLNMVAKIIKARQNLGVKRQIFFVKLGGFDTHDKLSSTHGQLLKDMSESIKAFYDATQAMGVANNVTTFTASDFGRTFVSNGDGSDHGWGAHHFVVGGAVNGKQFYGTAPEVGLDTIDDVGNGRLLPTTSVDQYAATLASWFGVPDSQIPSIAPNLSKFAMKNMGFV